MAHCSLITATACKIPFPLALYQRKEILIHCSAGTKLEFVKIWMFVKAFACYDFTAAVKSGALLCWNIRPQGRMFTEKIFSGFHNNILDISFWGLHIVWFIISWGIKPHIHIWPLSYTNSLSTITRVVIDFFLACVSALPCWNCVQFSFR